MISRSVFVVSIALTTLTMESAIGQQNRGRQIVQGLLKTFIESQLPPDQEPAPKASANRSARANSVGATSLTPAELREATRLLDLASAEMQKLVSALQSDIYRAQGVRQLLTLAMNVNYDATILARWLRRADDAESLREPLRKLDQDWRALEYQLRQTANLSATTRGHIQNINQYESQLVSMFQVAPQFDVRAVSDEIVQMNGTFRRLLEDIRYEVSDTTLANQLVQGGRPGYNALQELVQTSRSRPTYEQLTEDFEIYEREWIRYEHRLRRTSNRFVQRQVQRMNDSVQKVKKLLYLEEDEVNRDDLIYTVRLLQRDTDQLLRRVNLKMLTQLPTSAVAAIGSAANFATHCTDLLDVIEAGDDLDVLQEVFLNAHHEWTKLNGALQRVSSQPVRQSVRDIEQSVSQLQSQMHVRFDIDRGQLLEITTDLTDQAHHFEADINDFFRSGNRYSRDFQIECLRISRRFANAVQELHTGLTDGYEIEQLRDESDRVIRSWAQLNEYIPRFLGSDRSHLDRIRRVTAPQVVRLQTLLAF